MCCCAAVLLRHAPHGDRNIPISKKRMQPPVYRDCIRKRKQYEDVDHEIPAKAL
jgi:hypothetical protein